MRRVLASPLRYVAASQGVRTFSGSFVGRGLRLENKVAVVTGAAGGIGAVGAK